MDQHLRRERNGITPFDRLPTEILLNIAELAAIPTELHLKVGRTLLLHRLSWVCQSWRHALFAYPNIWTTISISEAPALLEHAVALSRSKPLIIRDTGLDTRRCAAPAIWKLLLTQRDRWKDVDVFLGNPYLDPDGSTHPPASQLETLRISPWSIHLDLYYPIPFPLHFFGPDLPHLRHLKLEGTQLGDDFPPVHNLETLHLKKCGATWTYIWSLIHSSAKLIDLELRNNDYKELDLWARPPKATEFPSLKRLNVVAASSDCSQILLQLIIFDCEDLVVQAYHYDYESEPLSSVWEKFIEVTASTINNSYKLSQDLGEIALTVKSKGSSASMSTSRWTVTTQNYSKTRGVTFDIMKDLYNLLHLPPNPSIHANFDQYPYFLNPQIISVLYRLPQIKTLQSTSFPKDLISYMTRPDADGNWLFPQMSHLMLENLSASRAVHALEDMVYARGQSYLAPLEYLSLEGEPIQPEDERRLAGAMKPGVFSTGSEPALTALSRSRRHQHYSQAC